MNARNLKTSLSSALLLALVACGSNPDVHGPTATAVAPARNEKALEADARRIQQLPSPSAIAPPMQAKQAPIAGIVMQEAMAYAPAAAPMPMSMPMPGDIDRENYAHHDDNPVQQTAEQPVSTFGIDVDTGSYTNVRRMLNEGQLPPADAVRAEEFINYFDYGYAPPADRSVPFSVTTELAPAPWNAKRQLLLIGIQGYRVPSTEVPAINLVFLIDTSGSMDEPDKLPLLKASLKQLVPKLRAQDRVSIVTYAGAAGIALRSTPGDQHERIDAAIDALEAGGSTNGGAGIDMAYAQAERGFIKHGVNRVILATDGDFNVGVTGVEALKSKIEDHRKSGVALSTLGFGEGNYNDAMASILADTGNGSHHYIDSLAEGRRVLAQESSATLLTIAKDVKIQLEFNPTQVQEYRLIGYEKRMLKREDFNNDQIDAGEIGAGANVTAVYEITRKGSASPRIDPLRYGKPVAFGKGGELGYLRLRYKLPDNQTSRLIEQPIDTHADAVADGRLRLAAAVAAFADALRCGHYIDGFDYAHIVALADAARGSDANGQRAGFVHLVNLADRLATPSVASNAQAGTAVTPKR